MYLQDNYNELFTHFKAMCEADGVCGGVGGGSSYFRCLRREKALNEMSEMRVVLITANIKMGFPAGMLMEAYCKTFPLPPNISLFNDVKIHCLKGEILRGFLPLFSTLLKDKASESINLSINKHNIFEKFITGLQLKDTCRNIR